MTATAPSETTTTVGYFNGQKCAIHVVISEYNVNLRLDPGRYVEDTQGRKINDPFFDRYKLLSKEVGEVGMPLIRLGRPKTVEPARDGQAVRQITEFKLDQHGHRQPVMPRATGIPQPSDSTSPVRAMSLAEARQAGLVRRVREVPEDYGAPDTSGPPPTHIPEMKFATDTAVHSKPLPLPEAAAELTAEAQKRDDALTRTMRESMRKTLIDAAKTEEEPEVVNPISKMTEVTALPAAEPDLPEPQIEPVAAKPPPQPLPARQRFICAADGRSFDFRSQLDMHVRRKFPNMYAELMKPYPKEG